MLFLLLFFGAPFEGTMGMRSWNHGAVVVVAPSHNWASLLPCYFRPCPIHFSSPIQRTTSMLTNNESKTPIVSTGRLQLLVAQIFSFSITMMKKALFALVAVLALSAGFASADDNCVKLSNKLQVRMMSDSMRSRRKRARDQCDDANWRERIKARQLLFIDRACDPPPPLADPRCPLFLFVSSFHFFINPDLSLSLPLSVSLP
jgi:hypothetical protein